MLTIGGTPDGLIELESFIQLAYLLNIHSSGGALLSLDLIAFMVQGLRLGYE